MNRPADLAALDAAIVRATQAGLPVCARPYDTVARAIGIPTALLLERLRAMLASGATCIAYETLVDEQGRLPLLTPMSEVAGRMSIQEGAKYL